MITISRWYDLVAEVGPDADMRPVDVVEEEYLWLARDETSTTLTVPDFDIA